VTIIGTREVNTVGYIKPKQRNYVSQPTTFTGHRKCDRCGLGNHTRDECRHKMAVCYQSNKVGHLKSECRSGATQTTQNPTSYTYRKKCRYVAEAEALSN